VAELGVPHSSSQRVGRGPGCLLDREAARISSGVANAR
jgi:hypothetical protein